MATMCASPELRRSSTSSGLSQFWWLVETAAAWPGPGRSPIALRRSPVKRLASRQRKRFSAIWIFRPTAGGGASVSSAGVRAKPTPPIRSNQASRAKS